MTGLLREALALFGPARVALPILYQEVETAAGGTRLLIGAAPHLAGAAEAACVTVLPDPDGVVRRFTADCAHGSRRHKPMSVWLAGAQQPADPIFHPDFTIDPASLRFLPAVDVLLGAAPPTMLRGRLVLLGTTDLALGDRAAVPRHRTLPGVILQALATESLLRERASPPFDPGFLPAVALLVGLLVIWAQCRPRLAVAIGLLLPATVEGIACLLHLSGVMAVATGHLHAAAALAFATALPLRAQLFERLWDEAARNLRQERALRARYLALSVEPVVIFDEAGRVVEANPAARRLFGSRDWLAQMFGPETAADLQRVVAGAAIQSFQCRVRAADGREVVVDGKAWSMRTGTGRLGVAQLRDVGEREVFLERLRFLTRHDQVTGLPNRAALLGDLATQPGGTEAYSLALIEIERFTELAAAVGIEGADTELLATTRCLLGALKEGEQAYRLEGDMFALSLRERDPECIRRRIERLARRAPEDAAVSEAFARIGLRAGIVVPSSEDLSANERLRRARIALLAARQHGCPIAFYDRDADAVVRRRHQLERALHRAIRARQLVVHFQPQVAAATGALAGCEALVRWRDPALGDISPALFVPIAEAIGLVDELTVLVLDQALAAQADWLDAGLRLPVSVNLSASTLARPEAVRGLVERAKEGPLGTPGVTFEVTESAVVSDIGLARSLLRELREAGARVAIDDFGTGHSSFAYLGTLPADELKLDRAFVRALPQDASARAIVTSVVELAARIGMSVVVEGVETDGQRDFLRSLGHHLLLQGHLVGYPADARAILTYAGGRSPLATLLRLDSGQNAGQPAPNATRPESVPS